MICSARASSSLVSVQISCVQVCMCGWGGVGGGEYWLLSPDKLEYGDISQANYTELHKLSILNYKLKYTGQLH